MYGDMIRENPQDEPPAMGKENHQAGLEAKMNPPTTGVGAKQTNKGGITTSCLMPGYVLKIGPISSASVGK